MVKHFDQVRIEKIKPRFDDSGLVSDAGLIVPATLAERLGLATLINEKLDLGARPGANRPEQKAMTLIHAMLAGADSIDDCDILRSGSTGAVLAHKVMAPSTLGTFLRSMSFGHVRQLEAVASELLRRAWSAGAGPSEDERLTINPTLSSARSTATKSRVPVSAIPVNAVFTRCSPPGPVPARFSASGCVKAPPTPGAGSSVSLRN